MAYLIIATICSAFIIIILKMIKMRKVNATVAITVNYVVAAAMTFLLSPKSIVVSDIVAASWFPISMVIGFMFMITLVVYAISADRSGVAITTISGRAAMAIPVIFAFVALDEEPTTAKISLLITILLSLVLILYRKKDENLSQNLNRKARMSMALVVLLPIIVFILNGVNDTMMQYAKKIFVLDNDDNMIFIGVLCLAAMVTGFLYYMIECRGRFWKLKWNGVMWGILLGLINGLCCIGMIYALAEMDGSIFFPLYYAGAVVIATLAGVFIFKEKLSPVNYVGILVALTAITAIASL